MTKEETLKNLIRKSINKEQELSKAVIWNHDGTRIMNKQETRYKQYAATRAFNTAYRFAIVDCTLSTQQWLNEYKKLQISMKIIKS